MSASEECGRAGRRANLICPHSSWRLAWVAYKLASRCIAIVVLVGGGDDDDDDGVAA